MDVFSHIFIDAFRLPPLKLKKKGLVYKQAVETQVFKRAQKLKVGPETALAAWRMADALSNLCANFLEKKRPDNVVMFEGAKLSELSALLKGKKDISVIVKSGRIDIDAPLVIEKAANVHIDFSGARLSCPTQKQEGYAVVIKHANGVSLRGARFEKCGNGIFVAGSRGVVVRDNALHDFTGYGIVVSEQSRHVVVSGNTLTKLNGAGITLHKGVRESCVTDNRIIGLTGSSNWNAAILLTDRNMGMEKTPYALLKADKHWVHEEEIYKRLDPPMNNLVEDNFIFRNKASGIYSDGAIANVIRKNIIRRNTKEGTCLDNGSTANVYVHNVVEENGRRHGLTDEELKLDFVLAHGRLPDGSAAAKLPGVSIDNALFNLVLMNRVSLNYGGGVKMVRTGLFNTVGLNAIVSNNEGRSKRFHFFGIELGAARADASSKELDFKPSLGNIIFSNNIIGSHYAGIFFGPGSAYNDVFDNVIMKATN